MVFCTACGGDSDKENVNPITISDDSSISAAYGESYAGAGPPATAAGPSSIPPAAAAGPSSIIMETDIAEGRVLHLRYIYQLSMEQRTRLIIKEIMQGT